MTNNKELKKCPFCGGTAYNWFYMEDKGIVCWVTSCDCGAKLDRRSATKEEAIETWNRRSEIVEDEK